ncbi:MAG TPA: ParA family protein [Bryobacteraceae bacterium]|nr:ParA family protein [Bryobacteraceae bacterium]
MQRLVIANQRGGVSKTTTTATLARFFGDQGMRVLAIDADPQGSLGLVLGLRPDRYLHDFLVHNRPLEECVVEASPNVHVLCGSRDTTVVEAALFGTPGRELAFSRQLSVADGRYDAVLIDVSPSINLLQTCSLLYAQQFLVPVAMNMLSLQGAAACLETAQMLADSFGTSIRPVALLPVMVDRRFSLTEYILKALEEMSEQYRVPLLHAVRTDGTVPRAERARQFLVDYDSKSKAMEDYLIVALQVSELLKTGQDAEPYRQALTA